MRKVMVTLVLVGVVAAVALVVLLVAGEGDVTPGLAGDDDCSPELVGEDAGRVTSIYLVDRGGLGELCFGTADSVIEDSWEDLAEIVPPEELEVLSLYAGFEADDGTLAFAGPLDDAHTEFVIAVDRITAGEDAAELKLTMAHEYAHVFTQVNSQFEPGVDEGDCDTYHNGAGCFLDGSFIADYVAEFWSDRDLASLPEDGTTDEAGGEDRCELDPSFLGAYAASHPEEDFAEVFSAYVFDVEVPDGVDDKLGFMDDRFVLQGYRDRALAASDTQLPNTFDRCG